MAEIHKCFFLENDICKRRFFLGGPVRIKELRGRVPRYLSDGLYRAVLQEISRQPSAAEKRGVQMVCTAAESTAAQKECDGQFANGGFGSWGRPAKDVEKEIRKMIKKAAENKPHE